MRFMKRCRFCGEANEFELPEEVLKNIVDDAPEDLKEHLIKAIEDGTIVDAISDRLDVCHSCIDKAIAFYAEHFDEQNKIKKMPIIIPNGTPIMH